MRKRDRTETDDKRDDIKQEQVERKQSHFFGMRKYHNWIKLQLLNKYCKNTTCLIDLSSGKGGDLDKWILNNLKYVEGYDIDETSIQEAERRKKEKIVNNRTYNGLNDLSVNFFILDLAKNIIPSRDIKFDIVTSMFAFHYMFDTEESLNTVLSSIDNNLKIGGYFIGCLFDNALLEGLSNKTSEYFSVKKIDPNCNSFYGNKIEVFINETVLDKPTIEYIVNFQQLIAIMFTRGYRLLESETFDKLYNNWTKYTKHYMREDEKCLSFLNRYFVFQRCK
jgi:ubiquinone/menaquinone biosynthesis C-methylase UbiE